MGKLVNYKVISEFQESKTNIDDVVDDGLLEVFGYLNHNEKYVLRTVSRRWKVLLEDLIPHQKAFGPPDRPELCDCFSTKDIKIDKSSNSSSSHGEELEDIVSKYKNLYAISIGSKIKLKKGDGRLVADYFRGKKVGLKHLSVAIPVAVSETIANELIAIVESCGRSIRHLVIYSDGSSIKHDELHISLIDRCPNLELLALISNQTVLPITKRTWNHLTTCEKLINLVITDVISSKMDLQLLTMGPIKESLKEISITIINENQLLTISSNFLALRSLKIVVFNLTDEKKDSININCISSLINLRELKIKWVGEETLMNGAIKNILKSCDQLSSLTMTGIAFNNQFFKIINNYGKNVKNLRISGSISGKITEVNGGLICLRSLTIEANLTDDDLFSVIQYYIHSLVDIHLTGCGNLTEKTIENFKSIIGVVKQSRPEILLRISFPNYLMKTSEWETLKSNTNLWLTTVRKKLDSI